MTWRARLVVVLLALCAALPLLGAATPSAAAAPAPGAPIGPPSVEHPVVVVGVDGLRWDRVDGTTFPTLSRLSRIGPTGVLAGRGADERTTVLDAWATVSAGNRARAHDLPAPAGNLDPGVAVAQRQTAPARTGARVGSLAEALGDRCVTAVGGRGATLAAADARGRLTTAAACPVVLVSVPAAAADAEIARWRGTASLLLVVGLGDVGIGDVGVGDVGVGDVGTGDVEMGAGVPTPPHLHLALAVDANDPRPTSGPLMSGSTRRTPYVQAIDIAPTVLAAFDVEPPPDMIGEPWQLDLVDRTDVGDYLEADRQARFMPTAVLGVVLPLVVVFVLVLGLAAALSWTGRRKTAWTVALWDSRIVAAVPVATFLARLFPYESWGLAGLWVLILAIDAVVLLVCRGRVAYVAVATAVVLAVDIVVGAPLQLHSVLGYSALVAGRFAGLGNPAFGAFAAAVLITAMLVGGALGGRGAPARRRTRVLGVALVGLVAVIVDGAPVFGSDVGGVLALVPAFALLGWAVAGRRVRVRTLLLAGLVAVGVLVLFAAADLARDPGSRTHLGRFASDLLAGRAGETLSRKAAANVALLTRNLATLLVIPVCVGFGVVLARTDRLPGLGPLARALREVPALRAGLVAALVTGALGFAVNDSGVVVPAVMMLLVVPATIEVAARYRASPSGLGVPIRDGARADVP